MIFTDKVRTRCWVQDTQSQRGCVVLRRTNKPYVLDAFGS